MKFLLRHCFFLAHHVHWKCLKHSSIKQHVQERQLPLCFFVCLCHHFVHRRSTFRLLLPVLNNCFLVSIHLTFCICHLCFFSLHSVESLHCSHHSLQSNSHHVFTPNYADTVRMPAYLYAKCIINRPPNTVRKDVQYVIFSGKPLTLECITGQSQRSRADFRHFHASTEDLLLHVILDVLACSAHWKFFC